MRTLVAFFSALTLAGCGVAGSPAGLDIPAPAASEAAELVLPTTSPSTQGCGSSDAVQIGTSEKFVNYAGVDRRYLVHIPDGYQAGVPTPVVVTMHGLGSNAAQQLFLTGITTNANVHNYIVVAPEATNGVWSLPPDDGSPVNSPEFGYIDAVLADMGNSLCLDPARQYASGMSMGSAMALALACSPERQFAAFGGVGASFYRSVCDATPPAPLIYFHGTADPVVPHSGGASRGMPVSSVPTIMADWAKHNGCRNEPDTEQIDDVVFSEWTQCKLSADVDYYEVIDGGHTWPGATDFVADTLEPRFGTTTTTVDATELMWQFFSRYTMPTPN